MIEDGQTYDTLRGVSIEGTGEIVEDPDAIWKVGVNVFERYTGPYTEEMKPFVEIMLNKRVAVARRRRPRRAPGTTASSAWTRCRRRARPRRACRVQPAASRLFESA